MKKQYILHIWRGAEARVVPVKGSLKKTINGLDAGEQDSVHLLEISAKGIPSVSDFGAEELQAAGVDQP